MLTWTRTEDELPEVGQRVYVAADGLASEDGCFRIMRRLQLSPMGRWTWVTPVGNRLPAGVTVTHWRPL